jgi:uncharacterized membrane protein YdjX (TVP38/TMEM64 family)
MEKENNIVMQKPPSWKDMAKNLAIIVITIGIAYIVTVTIGLDGLRDKVERAGVYAPFILVLLKATTIVVAPLGGTIIYPVAGALFGFWKGLLLTIIGDTIGSSIAFWISRKFGRKILHYFTGKGGMPIVEKVVENLGTRKQFVKARIFFTGFMDLFAYAAGLTKINFWFFLVVHIGIQAFLVALYILFGDLLVSGDFIMLLIVSLGSTAFAGLGVWLLHLDITRSN